MAGKSVSMSLTVTFKHQLLLLVPLLLLSVFHSLMECMHALNSAQPLNGLRIDLVHTDSLFSPNITATERLKRAVQRSQERLGKIQIMPAVTHILQGVDQTKDIQAPVSAGNGEFLMEMAIGNPALSFSAILDTGSDLIWTQCIPCSDCYQHSTPIYNPSQSSTYSTVLCTSSLCQALPAFTCNDNGDCEYKYTYGDASFTKGILSNETFTLSSQSFPHIAFGCGNDNKGDGFEGAGLVRFGRGPLSLVSQLGPSLGNKFSYCLLSVTDSPSKTSPLFLGHTASFNAQVVSSTPIIQSSSNPSYYYLSLQGISVDGELLEIPSGTFDLKADGSGGLIIDSGTTLTSLPQSGYYAVKEALSSLINLPQANGPLDLCFNQKGSSNPTFPTMTFHFKGADYDVPKQNYLFPDSSNDIVCLAMLPTTSGISIIGNVQQQNYHILYDNENNVLSFAPTACDTL